MMTMFYPLQILLASWEISFSNVIVRRSTSWLISMVVFNICVYNYVCNNFCVCVCVFNVCGQFYVCSKKRKFKWLCVCVCVCELLNLCLCDCVGDFVSCVWVKVILSYESIYLTFHFVMMETFAPFLVNPSFEHALHSHDLILISLYKYEA